MKTATAKKVLALVLTLALLLPNVAGVVTTASADTAQTLGTPNVYDIYDLTGAANNTILGTDATWDGQIKADVSAEHKENIVFKTKLTMGAQEIRLSINALDGASIYDPTGYSVFINHNSGAPYIAIKRNMQDLVVGSVAAVQGTWELEIGLLDILTDGVRTGKHLYVKKDGAVVCEVDDTNGYLTGDALGTKIVDFHYGAAIQMDTTYGNSYGTPNVYDIYDLTGSTANTIQGTDTTWDGQIHANVSAEHKENIVFKTKLTMGAQEVRLSINALDGANIYDPTGYSVFINHNGGAPYVAIKRNMQDLVVGSVASVQGTYVLEIGLLDILTGGTRIGKHLYVKMGDALICEVDDTDGYLTGDALGTKIVDFHYGAAIQMDSTYESSYGTPNVYDIYDLTGIPNNTIAGTETTWDGQIRADVSAEHKENFAFKTKMTMGAQEVRLSLTAKDGDSHYDPAGYAVYLYGASNEIDIRRNNTSLKKVNVAGLAGTYVFEVGIVDILFNGQRTGKHLYVKMNDEVVCAYDDASGYLTGDALGTKIIDFHYGAAIQMDTTYETGYGTPNVYDIYDLTDAFGVNISAWTSAKIGSIAAENKEQAAIKFNMNITNARHRYRFSVGAAEGVDCTDPHGYGLEIAVSFDGSNHVKFTRGSGSQIAIFNDVSGVIGEHDFEFGYRNITMGDKVAGKQVYLSVDGTVLYTYNDASDYLTGDTLGTMVALHHTDDPTVQLKSTYESSYGTPNVYDIYDLTGAANNTITGTDVNWDGQIHKSVSAEHKENIVFKTKLTMGAQEVRLSINALDGSSVYDPSGYAVYLYGASNEIDIRRNNTSLKKVSVAGVAGTYVFEVGILDILLNGNRIGKHLYVKMDDTVVCEYDDVEGYLTGDALGTKIIDFHYGAAIQMDTLYPVDVQEQKTYDVMDLTGKESNMFYGATGSAIGGYDEWVGMTVGNVAAADKENVNFKALVTVIAGKEVRFSMGALDSANAVDYAGYALSIGDGQFAFLRNGQNIFNGTGDLTGTYVLEFGFQDVIMNDQVLGKRITVKRDGQVLGTYDDQSDCLTGDALGTKIALFTYSDGVKADTTIPSVVNSYNLTLGGRTVMNLRLDPIAIANPNATVTISVAGAETVCSLQDLPADAYGYRIISVPLAAAQMNDEVAITVEMADGETVTKTYSVAGYSRYILDGEGYSAEQKATVAAMLHYGAAAQLYFVYNKDYLANEGYTDEVTNVIGSTATPVASGSVEGVRYYGTSLLLQDDISLRHYLNISGDMSSYSFSFNGKAVTPVSVSGISGANCYVQLDDILPNELDNKCTLTVSKGDAAWTLDYSPMSYIQRMSTKDDTKNLVQQLYDYHLATKTLASSKVADQAIVLDLYEISGKEAVTIPAGVPYQLGILVGKDDSFVKKELTNNVAIRFKYTGGEGMRLLFGAASPEISSTAGALFMSVPDNNSFGIANIEDNGSWCQDAAGNDLFSWQPCLGRDQVSYIEIGCVKRYTDGVYTHDRYYVRAAATVADLDAMAQSGTFSIYYDTTMKDNNGHLVIVRSRMDNGGDSLETTWTNAQIQAYNARVNEIAQGTTSGSYDALENKYPEVETAINTASNAATATKPSTTQATGGDELILWAESSTSKIVQDDDGKAASAAAQKNTLSIQMAKNEYEGAQLMLFGKRNVSYEVFVTDLVNGANTISADRIRLYQLKYLTVDDKADSDNTYDTPSAYAGEKLPDGMLPFAKAVEYGENSIIAGNNQAIFVDVSTKSTDAAGTYTGTVVVKTASHTYTLPISVVVENVVMPEASALGTYAPYLGRDSFTSGELNGSDEMAALYAKILADFNMSSIIPASDGVMNIEKFLVELRRSYDDVTNYLLPVDNTDSYYTVDGTNTLVYCNYTLMKEYVIALADMSIADGVNYLDKAFFYPSDHVDESITEDQFNLAKATYQAFCQMLDDADAQLTAKYAGTSMYTSAIANSVKNVRFLLTVPVDDSTGKALNVGTLLTEFLATADRKNVVLCTTNSVLTREGYGEDVASAMNGAYADELWTYLSLKPYYPHSNYAFDTPVVGLRTLGWICYQENVDTLMTWKSVNYLYGTDGLSLDRWTTSSAGTNTITPGDGNMFYPGAKYGIDGPCPSLRAIAWRDGVDDYNLMTVVAENGGSASSLTSLYSLITKNYTESIKASSETGSWWGSLISKNVIATVPIDDNAKFTVVRNALLQMAASDASAHAAIISNAQTAVNGVVTATGTVNALETPASESTASISGNIYKDGYYQLADFETYAETIQNKFSGNAQMALSSLAQNGNYSLKVAVQPGQDGGTVWIPTTSKYFSATTDFSGATKITFKVYNAQSADSTVRFYLNTYNRSGDVYNAGTYNKGSNDVWHDDHPSNTSFRFTLEPGWNEITVNASDFAAGALSYVGAFVIAFDSGVGYDAQQVFYLDDVRVYMSK